MLNDIKWLFFDVGSTLVDETECYNHRIRDAIAETDITFEDFNEKLLYFSKQNLKGDIEALRYFRLAKLLGIMKMKSPIKMPETYSKSYVKKDTV